MNRITLLRSEVCRGPRTVELGSSAEATVSLGKPTDLPSRTGLGCHPRDIQTATSVNRTWPAAFPLAWAAFDCGAIRWRRGVGILNT